MKVLIITLFTLLSISSLYSMEHRQTSPIDTINSGLEAIAAIEKIEAQGQPYKFANLGTRQRHISTLNTALWNLGYESITLTYGPNEIVPWAKKNLSSLKAQLNSCPNDNVRSS